MQTSAHDDEEVDGMYEEIEQLMEQEKGSDYLVVMGDFNAVIGEGRDGVEVGEYGLGKRNDRGEKLVEFCRRLKLVATNTWFRQHSGDDIHGQTRWRSVPIGLYLSPTKIQKQCEKCL